MITQETKIEKSMENVVGHEFAKPEMQEARAFLRERFLRVVTGIVGQGVLLRREKRPPCVETGGKHTKNGKRAEFNLHENSKVAGEFRGCDVDGLEIYVRDLETPLGKVPEAILRATDIIHYDVDGVTTER